MKDDTSQNDFHASRLLARVRVRVEFGDALVFFYALVFVRQYLWVVEGNGLAWSLAVVLAAALWLFYVSTKPFRAEGIGREFWLLVALPLVVVFALRAPFPDTSFDVLSYHLLHAERSLRGTLFAPGDFFPTPAPYNPAPDTLTGIARLALGYRLGTIINLFALVWTGQVLNKILRPFVAHAWARSAFVLLALLAEHALFEVNTYMVDLLALPLLLEATHLALRADETDKRRALYVHAALLLGACAALKLTSATAIPPLVVVFAYRALAGKHRLARKELALTSVLALVAFAAPLAPFAVYLYRTTGNPLFPLANGFFKSPYWSTGGGWDARWGPKGAFEILAWPVLAAFEPARHSELGVYSGKLALGFVAALAGLALVWHDARARLLSSVFLACCLLWSAFGMGYSRYGLHLELLSGVVVAAIASALTKGFSFASPSWKTKAPTLKTALASLFIVALAAQSVLAFRYVLSYEWSMRPTVLVDWRDYKYESRFFLRDRSLRNFLDEETRTRFDAVKAWISSGNKSNGVEVLLDADAPIFGVNNPEYFATREGQRDFIRAIEDAPGERMFSLCPPEDCQSAKELIKRRGLSIVSETPVRIPFFSSRRSLSMMLLEVERPRETEARRAFETSWTSAPFPDYDYRAEISSVTTPPVVMRAGERAALRFRVRNRGGSVWPASGDAHGMHQVNIGDRWLDREGVRVINDLDGRTALPVDLSPGEEVELTLTVNAPRAAGEYVLEIDMIHEGVTFFFDKGSRVLRVRVRVEP